MAATPPASTSNNNNNDINVAPANGDSRLERRRNRFYSVFGILSSHLQEDLSDLSQSANRIAELETSIQELTERAEEFEKRGLELGAKVKDLEEKLLSKEDECKEINEKCNKLVNEMIEFKMSLTPFKFPSTDSLDFNSDGTRSPGIHLEEINTGSQTFDEDFNFNCDVEVGDTKFVTSSPQPSTSTFTPNLSNRSPNTARRSTRIRQINRLPSFLQQHDLGRDHGQASKELGVDGAWVYVCKCKKRFKNQKCYYKHTRAMWKAWKCSDCDKSFLYFRPLAKHLRNVHGKDIKDDFGCHFCGETFEDSSQISIHGRHCMKRRRVKAQRERETALNFAGVFPQ